MLLDVVVPPASVDPDEDNDDATDDVLIKVSTLTGDRKADDDGHATGSRSLLIISGETGFCSCLQVDVVDDWFCCRRRRRGSWWFRCRPATVSEDRGGAGNGLSASNFLGMMTGAPAVVFRKANMFGRRGCDSCC